MITRLTNNIPIIVSPEPEPEPQQPPAPPAGLGIAGTSDGFESADSAVVNYSNLMQQGSEAVSQPVFTPEAVVDASSMFDYVEQTEQPAPPASPEPPEAGLGQKLEEFTEKKIVDTYEQKTTKDFGPAPDRSTSAETATWGNEQMPDNLGSLGKGGGTTVAGLEGSWNLFEFGKIDEKAEGDWGSAYAKGSTQVLGVSGQVYANAGVDLDNKTVSASLGAKGSLEIVGAHYEAGYRTPDAKIGDEEVNLNGKVNFDAYVGATGNAEIGVTLGGENKVKIGAGAFDGAHAEMGGEIGVADMGGVTGNIKGWTGVGAKAGFGAEYKNGTVKVDLGLGLALGIGAEWDLGLKVDFSEIIDTGLEGMREIGLEEEADWIENTAGDAIEFAGDAAKWAGDTAEDIGNEIGDAANDAGDVIGDAIDEIGGAAEDVGDTIGDAAGDVGDWLDDWI
ncbi:hypothetical protein L0222_20805 [bacterium]|nr:hypothetical protein [bacterium]MCI0603772.1 hypothetical protein [bacterium]